MIKVILWDIDGTLLNFKEAEKAAIRSCFSIFHLGECTDEMIERYSSINERYWKRLERGEISKQEVLEGRFREFFQTEHSSGKWQSGCLSELRGEDSREMTENELIEAFNAEYQVRLGDTICFNDNGLELVKRLKGTVKQYAVTNGTHVAQKRKLEKSGLNELLDGAFISDEIGIEKPNVGFFQHVLEQIGEYEKDQVMIVGDSLTSDIRGGNNAGIVCCWYRPEDSQDSPGDCGQQGEVDSGGLSIDYEIQNLQEIEALLEKHHI